MAKSKLQRLLSESRSRSKEFAVFEFVPVVFNATKDELYIFPPQVGEFNDVINETATLQGGVSYSGKDITTAQGREDVKESIADVAGGLDVRAFVVAESKRKNDKTCVYEYDVYTQFQKFLIDISKYSKLNESDKRHVYRTSVRVEKKLID